MNLSDCITRVADDGNVNSSATGVKARIIREINRVCSEMWDGFRWSFRWRNYRIVTDIDVTTGTITATNGSRTITGSGTSFLSTHKNWQIYFGSDAIQNWYKIRKYTSATQLELDVPYQGTTGSSKTYVLRHFDYYLPTEPWDIGSTIVTANNRPVAILEPYSMDIIGPVPFYKGTPLAVSIYSSDFLPTAYTTGTISGTINTNTLTGVGTLWLDNVYPGDSVTIGSYTYTVATVDSDTQITLYNNLQVAVAALSTYSNVRQFGRVLRIMWASTDPYVLDIRALRKYAPLVNDYDTNEILYRYSNTIVTKAAALELKQQNDMRSRELLAEAEIMIQKARAEDESLTPRDHVAPIFSYRMDRRQQYDGDI